jgi:hypothetical protein
MINFNRSMTEGSALLFPDVQIHYLISRQHNSEFMSTNSGAAVYFPYVEGQHIFIKVISESVKVYLVQIV